MSMNRRKEKEQKLHSSLINMLYAPPSPPTHHTQFNNQTLNLARENVKSDHNIINSDEFEGVDGRSGDDDDNDDDDELGFQKMTRAQRKRLRKRKLKEAGLKRREIIGPELPSTGDDQRDGESCEAEGVQQNATKRVESENEHSQTPSCIKVKHRRMSKKKAMEKLKTPPTDPTDLSNNATSPAD